MLLGGSEVPGDLLPPTLMPLLVWGQEYDLLSLQDGGSGVFGRSVPGLGFVLFHFGIWVTLSLPTLCSSRPLIKWARSRTFFLVRLSRSGKGHADLTVSVCLPVPLKTIHPLFICFSFEKLTWNLFNIYSFV